MAVMAKKFDLEDLEADVAKLLRKFYPKASAYELGETGQDTVEQIIHMMAEPAEVARKARR